MRNRSCALLVFLVALMPATACTRKQAPPTKVNGRHSSAPAAPAASDPARQAANPEPAADASIEATGDTAPKRKAARTPDVQYVPTPQPVVDMMLELAKPKKTDLLYDLGCGDGRIVVTAAKKYGVRAVGYDIDPERVEEAIANVRANGLEQLVSIEEKDIFTIDLSKANVVTLYLLPELNVKLVPQLQKLKRGSRVVSHDFDIEGYQPDKHLTFTPPPVGIREHQVYLFTIPLRKAKD